MSCWTLTLIVQDQSWVAIKSGFQSRLTSTKYLRVHGHRVSFPSMLPPLKRAAFPHTHTHTSHPCSCPPIHLCFCHYSLQGCVLTSSFSLTVLLLLECDWPAALTVWFSLFFLFLPNLPEQPFCLDSRREREAKWAKTHVHCELEGYKENCNSNTLKLYLIIFC